MLAPVYWKENLKRNVMGVRFSDCEEVVKIAMSNLRLVVYGMLQLSVVSVGY